MKLILSLLLLPVVVMAGSHAELSDEPQQQPIRQTAFKSNKTKIQLVNKLEEAQRVTGAKVIECNLAETERLIAYQMLIDTPEFNSQLKGLKVRLVEGQQTLDSNLWVSIDIRELEDKSQLKVTASNLKTRVIDKIKNYQMLVAVLKFKYGVNVSCTSHLSLEECNTKLTQLKIEERFHPMIKNKTIILDTKFENEGDAIVLNARATNEKALTYLKAIQ
jgi:hypothetical protein